MATKLVNGVRVELSESEITELNKREDEHRKEEQKTGWSRKRKNEYPKLEKQLDLIWDDIDKFDALNKEGKWFNQIKEIKEKYPKQVK